MIEEIEEIWHLIQVFLFSKRSIYIEASIIEICMYLGGIVCLVNMIRYLFASKPKEGRSEQPRKKIKRKKWYPTGWVWNDEKQLWEPPDFIEK